MDQQQQLHMGGDGYPPPLTPERVERALERVAAVHERLRERGVDLSQLPGPVEELVKARDAGGWA